MDIHIQRLNGELNGPDIRFTTPLPHSSTIATFYPMPQRVACHLASSALSPNTWPQTMAALRAARIGSFTCDLADLDGAATLVESNRPLSLLGVELSIDVRSEIAPAIAPHQARWLAAHRVMLLLRLSSSDSYDKPSAPRAMPFAAACVNRLARSIAPLGLAIALDARAGFWMQRVEDGVRVAMRVNRADVGVLFNLGDWHEVDGDAHLLSERVKLAMPKLMGVSIPVRNLATGPSDIDAQAVTLAGAPLDTGPLMHQLTLLGYQGPIVRR